MDKPAADYFKNPPVVLAGFMPRKAVVAGPLHAMPRANAYDLSQIPLARTEKNAADTPIETVQAGASLRKDRTATSISFGKLLRRRAPREDPFIERLNRLSGA